MFFSRIYFDPKMVLRERLSDREVLAGDAGSGMGDAQERQMSYF